MKILTLFILLTAFVYADNRVKGQTYYQYILKDSLGYNGAVFAKKYTKKQWQDLFDNDAKALKHMLITQNQELEAFTKSAKFTKISPFLKAFVLSYAKDVKTSPSCN